MVSFVISGTVRRSLEKTELPARNAGTIMYSIWRDSHRAFVRALHFWTAAPCRSSGRRVFSSHAARPAMGLEWAVQFDGFCKVSGVQA